MAKLDSESTGRSMGSLIKGAPGGIRAESLPLKVTVRPLPPTMADWPADGAICAPPIRTGLLPYSFESTMRMRAPPRLSWTTCRMVCSCSTAGILVGNAKSSCQTGCGLAIQLLIQTEDGAALTVAVSVISRANASLRAHARQGRAWWQVT